MRISDWSSDVCSSDLQLIYRIRRERMMGPFEMVVAIVLIATVGQILRARYKSGGTQLRLADDPDAQKMRDEIKTLRDRVAVLERIATDREHRSEEHTSELQSLMRISYAVFCLKK